MKDIAVIKKLALDKKNSLLLDRSLNSGLFSCNETYCVRWYHMAFFELPCGTWASWNQHKNADILGIATTVIYCLLSPTHETAAC